MPLLSPCAVLACLAVAAPAGAVDPSAATPAGWRVDPVGYEVVSHSRYWGSTATFVTEDDA